MIHVTIDISKFSALQVHKGFIVYELLKDIMELVSDVIALIITSLNTLQ